ncbi:MAG: Txe/YoeB family addiction module toxin [Deltaproteobacteria bacterium]|nr:Txe/YoeB family addiction module toxin [Deltaproteobacteria bacterium]
MVLRRPCQAQEVHPGAEEEARELKLASAGLKPKTVDLLELLRQDPFRTPPRFDKPVDDLSGAFSRRINIQHRLVYQVLESERIVEVLRMWTHYEQDRPPAGQCRRYGSSGRTQRAPMPAPRSPGVL